jgi:hypothetical protein
VVGELDGRLTYTDKQGQTRMAPEGAQARGAEASMLTLACCRPGQRNSGHRGARGALDGFLRQTLWLAPRSSGGAPRCAILGRSASPQGLTPDASLIGFRTRVRVRGSRREAQADRRATALWACGLTGQLRCFGRNIRHEDSG